MSQRSVFEYDETLSVSQESMEPLFNFEMLLSMFSIEDASPPTMFIKRNPPTLQETFIRNCDTNFVSALIFQKNESRSIRPVALHDWDGKHDAETGLPAYSS